MHEMSLMESVREIVEDAARLHRATRVEVVRLEIGVLAAVDPEALRFAFDVVMRGGPAAQARLIVDPVPGRAWCWDCSESVAVTSAGAPCPACGHHRLEVTGGTEMRVRDIDLVSDAEALPCA